MSDDAPDLAMLAGQQLAACLDGRPVRSELETDATLDLQSTLELLIPQVLRRDHPEWRGESIDGFNLSSAAKTAEKTAAFVGTCILISDQTVTPVAVDIALTGHSIQRLRIRLGEPGAGLLGISGPQCNSSAAGKLLTNLASRLDRVPWTYDVTVEDLNSDQEAARRAETSSVAARTGALRDLVELRTPLDDAVRAVGRLGWDHEVELVTLSARDVVRVLNRLLEGSLTATECTQWADAIEGRDDIACPPEIREAIFQLASPELNAPLTPETAQAILRSLTRLG